MQDSILAEISQRANHICIRETEKLAAELKSLHARNVAKGRLRSGATIKESARIARASIQQYFAELEQFVRELPDGSGGSDHAVVDAVSSSTALLIATVNERLAATAILVGDAGLVRHVQPQISEELSVSQETFRSNLRAHWLKSSALSAPSRIEIVILVCEVLCFVLAVIFSVLWWEQERSGAYEPRAAFFGLLGGCFELVRQHVGRHKQ